jgi:RNA polymerase sigma-70 factor (ECF subfamily)
MKGCYPSVRIPVRTVGDDWGGVLTLRRHAAVAAVAAVATQAARTRAVRARVAMSVTGRVELARNLRVGLGVLAMAVEAAGSATGSATAGSRRAVTAGSGPGARAGSQATPEHLARIEALVQLAQAGDAEAFGQIYEEYVDVVYRYLYVRCGSHHLAEDLTAETFVRALRRLDSFTWTGKDIAAWFVTIARNLVLDHAKSSRFRMEITTAELLDPDEHADAPETEVLDRMRDRRLLEAVKDLRAEQQECIVLRFLQGLSLAETAAVMGRKQNAIKQLQLRAVRSLHRALEGERP